MKNTKLVNWVRAAAGLCRPDAIYWCDGRREEYDGLMAQMINSGVGIPLKKRPKSFLFRSDPSDVARTEERTYLATSSNEDAGPTAAIIGKVGVLRRDPFAMMPFCGYNMADYFQHWFDMGKRLGSKAPRILYVNWFRKNQDGKWLWPGYGDNSRVLKWMCERIEGKVGGRRTPIGYLPNEADLDLKGLTIQPDHVRELLKVGPQPWKAEVQDIKKFFAQFGSRLPERLREQLRGLATRLEQQELRDEWRIIWVINFMWVVCPIQSLKRSWKRSFPSTALLYQHV